MILDSVGDGMYRSYEDGSAALYATVDESNVLITAINGVLVINFDKEHAKCIVHRIPNDFSFAQSARAITVSCFPVSNFRMNSPPCSTPVCLTAVKIVAKATSTVPFSCRRRYRPMHRIIYRRFRLQRNQRMHQHIVPRVLRIPHR
jgi:hypothetical protein